MAYVSLIAAEKEFSMNKLVLVALLCPLFGTMCNAQIPVPNAPTLHPGLPGGYAAYPCDGSDVQDAKAYLQGLLPFMTLGEVTEAASQVVAGLNLVFTCAVVDAEGPAKWQFGAFRSLDGHWHFYSANRL
jgi:hypothetical protein